MQHAKAPGSVKWEPGEAEDINLIQACLILHQPPEVVERMSAYHVALVLEVHGANQQIKADQTKAAHKKGLK